VQWVAAENRWRYQRRYQTTENWYKTGQFQPAASAFPQHSKKRVNPSANLPNIRPVAPNQRDMQALRG
jgi:hypothetical protein